MYESFANGVKPPQKYSEAEKKKIMEIIAKYQRMQSHSNRMPLNNKLDLDQIDNILRRG